MREAKSIKMGAVQKNSQEEIRVTLQTYEGTELIDVRTYWQTAEGNWIPTKKGISLTHHVAEDVSKLIQKAFKKMEVQSQEDASQTSNNLRELLKLLRTP